MTLFLTIMQLGCLVFPVTLLVFKGAGFNRPTDLTAVTYKWNTVNLFIRMRYVRIVDYDIVMFRYSCGTLCGTKSY